jgi:hypothetical protein
MTAGGKKFIGNAVSIVTQAIQEDNAGNYERALGLYKQVSTFLHHVYEI